MLIVRKNLNIIGSSTPMLMLFGTKSSVLNLHLGRIRVNSLLSIYSLNYYQMRILIGLVTELNEIS